jgi:hypothetical protein
MNWLIVVVFATMTGDVYIFTDPKFDTREECVASIKDPNMVPVYSKKLVMEYGRLLPIRGLNCLQEDEIKRIIKGVEESKA